VGVPEDMGHLIDRYDLSRWLGRSTRPVAPADRSARDTPCDRVRSELKRATSEAPPKPATRHPLERLGRSSAILILAFGFSAFSTFCLALDGPKQACGELGLELVDWMSPGGAEKGVLVTRADASCLAARLGVREGEVITAVNGQPATNLGTFERAVIPLDSRGGFSLTVLGTDGVAREVAFPRAPVNTHPDIDYGSAPSTSGSAWLFTVLWGSLCVLLTLFLSPRAPLLYGSSDFGWFVAGAAAGGAASEAGKAKPNYAGGALAGVLVALLFPIMVMLIGPIGVYYFFGRPLLHRLGGPEHVLCCVETVHASNQPIATISDDGRWLAYAVRTSDPLLLRKTSDYFVYLVDLQSGRFVDWGGGFAGERLELTDSSGAEQSANLTAVGFSGSKDALILAIQNSRGTWGQPVDVSATGLRGFRRAGEERRLPARFKVTRQLDDTFEIEDASTSRRFSLTVSPGWERYRLSPDGRVLALIQPEQESGARDGLLARFASFVDNVFRGKWRIEFWDIEKQTRIRSYDQYLFNIDLWVQKSYVSDERSPFVLPSPDGRRWVHVNSHDGTIKIFDLTDRVPPPIVDIPVRTAYTARPGRLTITGSTEPAALEGKAPGLESAVGVPTWDAVTRYEALRKPLVDALGGTLDVLRDQFTVVHPWEPSGDGGLVGLACIEAECAGGRLRLHLSARRTASAILETSRDLGVPETKGAGRSSPVFVLYLAEDASAGIPGALFADGESTVVSGMLNASRVLVVQRLRRAGAPATAPPGGVDARRDMR